ncbi:outer membrane beta-barrel protein [Desulfogranum marinum]|uniref:outer membrane beta-barrel protein n=1 Tax=Desulfogranum marinum TaxID=453220 RepID=UPI0019649C0D|nr:OmpW family outer membrane protein [Desulfogranum marinum]MBM9514469.1 outer membrane beta-barrel protein [Desulfogranum marinum]
MAGDDSGNKENNELDIALQGFSDATWHESEENEVSEKDSSEKQSHFYADYLAGRLEIGTRVTSTILTDSDSGAAGGPQGEGTFLGTIYALDEIQDYTPKNIFARYYFSKYIGVELAYDSVEAETVAPSVYTTTKTDGDVSLAGPTVSLVGRYPNSSSFTPYVSMGLGFFTGDFEEADDWALGYYDPAEYAALGSPTTSYNGVTRVMDIDNEIAFLIGIGVAYSVTEHFSLDVSMHYTAVEADATFSSYKYGILTSEQDGSFPLDNVAVRAGLTFTF